MPNAGAVGVGTMLDERKHRLRDLVPVQALQFWYEYDFGDGWKHELLVENILAPQEGVRYSVCLAGARAYPPEDVGGMAGYEDFLAAINDSRHPEHQESMAWGQFDPEAFDANEVSRKL